MRDILWRCHVWREAGYDLWNLSFYRKISDTKIEVQKLKAVEDGTPWFEVIEMDKGVVPLPYVFQIPGPDTDGLKAMVNEIAERFNIFTDVDRATQVKIVELTKQYEFLKEIIRILAGKKDGQDS